MTKERASRAFTSPISRQTGALLTGVCAAAIAVAISSTSASAMPRHRAPAKAAEHASKEPFGDVQKGPVEIIVSIDQQKLHLYSNGQHVADTSVATGVPSLPTPLGVFDVIQKQIFHRSNIYSGAPMPFMQRITWSGVALHEGENIGHRASHGCIRMPHDFAARLYQFTRLGARVIVANGELTPSEISDPHLFVHKVAPAPDAPPMAVADPAKTQAANTPTDDGKKADAAEKVSSPVAGQPNDNATANVSGQTTASSAATTTGDTVSPSTAEPTKPAADDVTKSSDANTLKSDVAKSDSPSSAPFGEPPVPTATKTVQPILAAATTIPVRLAQENLRGTDASPTLVVDASDTVVPAPVMKPSVAPPVKVENKTPIAIFVSRKTQRIYVRQNFAPLFDAAITIDHPEQPLGTHVFTALDYQSDHSTFRWDVVSMPGEQPKVKQVELVRDRYGRLIKREQWVEKQSGSLPSPQTPAQALARIEIPQDVIDRISELMMPSSSLIISDQGLGEETGEGTDFIVVSR